MNIWRVQIVNANKNPTIHEQLPPLPLQLESRFHSILFVYKQKQTSVKDMLQLVI